MTELQTFLGPFTGKYHSSELLKNVLPDRLAFWDNYTDDLDLRLQMLALGRQLERLSVNQLLHDHAGLTRAMHRHSVQQAHQKAITASRAAKGFGATVKGTRPEKGFTLLNAALVKDGALSSDWLPAGDRASLPQELMRYLPPG